MCAGVVEEPTIIVNSNLEFATKLCKKKLNYWKKILIIELFQQTVILIATKKVWYDTVGVFSLGEKLGQ